MTDARAGRDPREPRLVVVDAVPSTNDRAWALGRALPPSPRETTRDSLDSPGVLGDARVRVAVLAREQTAGRGRAGRAWSSPPGAGLYLSFYLRPAWPPARAALLTVAAALAARDACARYGVTPALKWPNDLLAPDGSGRKLAGILTETRSEGGVVHEAVIGVGVNLTPPEAGWPAEIEPLVATLAEQGAAPAPDATELALEILSALDRATAALAQPDGVAELVARARAASTLWGRRVRVEAEQHVAHGIAKDLADDGGLVVRLDAGTEIVVHAGDVHVRWDAP